MEYLMNMSNLLIYQDPQARAIVKKIMFPVDLLTKTISVGRQGIFLNFLYIYYAKV